MTVFVFAGPTLTGDDARAILPDAAVLPPVSQGDVIAAVRERPWGIAIVDGYFERVPAVWHKEILWALAQGVHVFGAASMGALRAAELAPFGMVGVGKIFEAFRDGVLEDDDEVTLVHGPPETGYLRGSEPMVNIRSTLAAARAAGVCDQATERALIEQAKALFYPERSWPVILSAGREAGLPGAPLEAVAAWWPAHAVDQKRLDALALLEVVRETRRSHPGPFEAGFHFERSDAWEQVRRQIDRRPLGGGAGGETRAHDAVLDELRLQHGAWAAVHEATLRRSLALDLADRQGDQVGVDQLTRAVEAFRVGRGLETPASVSAWLEAQALTIPEFTRLIEDEARVGRILEIYASEVDRFMPDVLRLSGEYGELAARAREKQDLLGSRGLDNPSLADAGVSEASLWQWFFVEHQRVGVPADLAAWARSAGFPDADAARRSVLREYCFLQRRGPPGGVTTVPVVPGRSGPR